LNLLLDTCAFLWIAQGAPQVSPTALELFRSPDNRVFLSSVSAWEIAVKHGLGRLPLSDPPDLWVPRERERHAIEALPVDEEAVLQLPRLPDLHRDPFDRMLVCQAIAGGLVLLTPDRDVAQYPVRSRW
jgi:PIN domain nuclease of toxin-antitoxin system